jgi:hypothetical protein
MIKKEERNERREESREGGKKKGKGRGGKNKIKVQITVYDTFPIKLLTNRKITPRAQNILVYNH